MNALVKKLLVVVGIATALVAQYMLQLYFSASHVPMTWGMFTASIWQYAYVLKWVATGSTLEEVESVYRQMDLVPLPSLDIRENYFFEGTWEELMAQPTHDLKDKLVVVRGFLTDEFADYKTPDGFKAQINNTKHLVQRGDTFLSATTTKDQEKMLMHEMVDRMEAGERLYGGFITNMQEDNPGLNDLLNSVLKRFQGTVFDEFSSGECCLLLYIYIIYKK